MWPKPSAMRRPPVSWGSLTNEQAEVVARHVAGREVADLGAGDGRLTLRLVEFGAIKVVAVEKERLTQPERPEIEWRSQLFADQTDLPNVVFCSWPSTHANGLAALLRTARVVILLSKNTDGTVCGSPRIFNYLRQRALLAYVPARRNTLSVYGSELVRRPATGEERAATDRSRIYRYEEVERESAGAANKA